MPRTAALLLILLTATLALEGCSPGGTDDLPLDPDDDSYLSASSRLLLDAHTAPSRDYFGAHPATHTCYVLLLNRYGALDEPERADCPSVIRPLHIPPAPPRSAIPVGLDRTLRHLLRAGPADEAALRAAITSRLSAPRPSVDVEAGGSGVGVAVRDDDGSCLLGSRVAGRVRVYYPPRESVLPGEVPCDATTALGPLLHPAH